MIFFLGHEDYSSHVRYAGEHGDSYGRDADDNEFYGQHEILAHKMQKVSGVASYAESSVPH